MAEEFRTPQSANEALLQNILGAENEIREPQSVTEYYLKKIWEQGGGGGGTGHYVSYDAQTLTEAQKIQALLNLDGVRIVALTDGTVTLAELEQEIAAINERGEHVFFDTATLSYPLFLCTIAINYENNVPVSYRLNDLVSGNISLGAFNGSLTLADILANAVNAFYTLTVTAVTQDGVTVTGQTVTVRQGGAEGEVYATAAYNGQPVSFSLPNGFAYFVSISDTLSGHFAPSTAQGVISDTNASCTLTYLDPTSVSTFQEIQAALNTGADMSGLVGHKVHWTRNNVQEDWVVDNYDAVNHEVRLEMDKCLKPGVYNSFSQLIMYCEEGLPAGDYSYVQSSKTYYFTLTKNVPAGGRIGFNNSGVEATFANDAKTIIETFTSSTTEIPGATDLGTAGQGLLNESNRISYKSSNNYGESLVRKWLNTADVLSLILPTTKFDKAQTGSTEGFLAGVSPDDLACVADTVWKCSANVGWECPAALGGMTTAGRAYTVTDKFGLLSEKEVFGSYSGVDAGDSQLDLYKNAIAEDRIKYDGNSTAQNWWLRSPLPNSTNYIRYVRSNGNLDSNFSGSYGIVPACAIRKTT